MMGGCHDAGGPASTNRATLTIALAGNPNCGKSALFNAFTGIRQKTGNWPGVTVDRKEGRFELDGREVAAIDLPGIYSLDANSLDEEITRDYLLSRDADLVINVVDAATLRFGPNEAASSDGYDGNAVDVDGDGYVDLKCHFRVPDTGIAVGDEEACLSGSTWDGVPIEGCAPVDTKSQFLETARKGKKH